MATHNDLGKKGEALAVDFLTAKGFKILAKNWRFRKAEVDIIANENNTIVFIEVKTRSYDTVAKPHEAVTRKKEKLLIEAAEAYMEKMNLNHELRFDLVAIILKSNQHSIEHLKGAF